MKRLVSGWMASGLLAMSAAAALAAPEPRAREDTGLELWLVVPPGVAGTDLRQALEADLARTPRRHHLRFATPVEVAAMDATAPVLALLALEFDEGVAAPRLALTRGGDALTPGWLVHAVVRASETVGVSVALEDGRSSWIGQLVARSTRRQESAADAALARGVASARLRLPGTEPGEPGEKAVQALAATVRRLDGLDSAPVFEDQFLFAWGRVWLRRDLYWLGLLLWLALYWRGRARPGQQFRWLLLAAWLIAPVFAAVLLTLPAFASMWRSAARWAAGLALLPAAIYGGSWAVAVGGGALPVISVLPALLTTAALGLFCWHGVLQFGRAADPPPLSASGGLLPGE